MTTLNVIDWELDQLEYIGIPHIDELVAFANRLCYEPNDPDVFDYLDECIKNDSLAFVRQGIALGRICRYNLFRFKKFKSFSQYCLSQLHKSVTYCNRLMQAAALVLRLINLGFTRLPQNESQCRPLTRIKDDAELEEKWELILGIADTPSHKGIITASLVADVMEIGNEKKSLKVSPEVYGKLQRLSAGSGKTIDELLNEALDAYSPDEEEEPAAGEETATGESDRLNFGVDESTYPKVVPAAEKLANWQNDLEALVNEHQDIRGMPAANSS